MDVPVGCGLASSSSASAAYLPATRREVGPRLTRGRLGPDSPLGTRAGERRRQVGRAAGLQVGEGFFFMFFLVVVC